MNDADLLVGTKSSLSLTDFAHRFFEIADIPHFEMRDSENYVDGHYYIARGGPRTFKVMRSDSSDHGDLPYWIRVSAAGNAEPLTMAEIDALALELVHNGYKVARISDFKGFTEDRFNYSL
jgi:hypothetical protein